MFILPSEELFCTRDGVPSMTREVTVPLYVALVKLYLKCVGCWAPRYKKDYELVKHVQKRAMKLVKNLKNKTREE